MLIIFSSFAISGEDDEIFKNGFEEPELVCTTDVYPPGLFRENGTYEQYNDGEPFGVSTNTSFLLDIRINRFVVLDNFSYPQVNAWRRIVFVDAPTNHNMMHVGTISVSECPGDFSETATCRISVHNNKTIFVTTRPGDSDIDPFCKLDPNKSYYINYVLTDDPYNGMPECADVTDTVCAMFYSETLLSNPDEQDTDK